MEPRFSVIIPAYNVEKYIAATLSSVWNQSFQDFEVIVINDGSTDNTQRILDGQTDVRIKVINIPNQGVSHARNTGITHAEGTYIAFLDGDDIWYPDHLENAATFFSDHDEINWYASHYVSGRDFLPRNEKEKPTFHILNFFLSGAQRVWTSCVILKKSAIPAGLLFPEHLSLAEDLIAWLRYAEHNPKLGYCTKTTAWYCARESSVMHSQKTAMSGLVDFKISYYDTFHNIVPTSKKNRIYFKLRKYELFADSFSYILSNASLSPMLQVIRSQRKSCGLLLALYMSSTIVMFSLLTSIILFPLNAYVKLYRKFMKLINK